MLSTVQDAGRRGFQRQGVSVGGAMDGYAMRVANRLVGNPETAATLEMTLIGPTLEFERDALIAICGAQFSPTIGQHAVPLWRAVRANAGAVLAFGSCAGGCRAYLAVAGGIDVPIVLGSRATHLRAKFGGLEGRALRVGDVLPSGTPSEPARRLMDQLAGGGDRPAATEWRLGRSVIPSYPTHPTIRVVSGAGYEQMNPASQQRFLESSFIITADSDRMGYRLQGPTLDLPVPTEPISQPICMGSIQLLPQGQMVVLMADCQTTGGYPQIAHVASADQQVVAQLKPGDSMKFTRVSLAESQDLLLTRQREWSELALGVSRQLDSR
jgi:antagonist of KipI